MRARRARHVPANRALDAGFFRRIRFCAQVLTVSSDFEHSGKPHNGSCFRGHSRQRSLHHISLFHAVRRKLSSGRLLAVVRLAVRVDRPLCLATGSPPLRRGCCSEDGFRSVSTGSVSTSREAPRCAPWSTVGSQPVPLEFSATSGRRLRGSSMVSLKASEGVCPLARQRIVVLCGEYPGWHPSAYRVHP